MDVPRVFTATLLTGNVTLASSYLGELLMSNSQYNRPTGGPEHFQTPQSQPSAPGGQPHPPAPVQQYNNQAQYQPSPAPQPYGQPQARYAAPVSNANPNLQVQAAESIGAWMLTLFLISIPIVGLVYLLVVAFGGSVAESKKNFARAALIWQLIAIGLVILIAIVTGGAIFSIFAGIANA